MKTKNSTGANRGNRAGNGISVLSVTFCLSLVFALGSLAQGTSFEPTVENDAKPAAVKESRKSLKHSKKHSHADEEPNNRL